MMILLPCLARAQQGLILDAIDNNVINDDLLKTRYKEVLGSPYYYEDFRNGKVVFVNGMEIDNVPLRIDVFAGTVQIEKNGTIIEYENQHIKSVVLIDGNMEAGNFEALKIDNKVVLARSYFDDKIKLLAAPVVTRKISSTENTSYSTDFQQDKFIASTEYYLFKDGTYHEIKLTRKSIMSVLGNISGIQGFVKSEKIKFNRLDDVVELLKYCNDKI